MAKFRPEIPTPARTAAALAFAEELQKLGYRWKQEIKGRPSGISASRLSIEDVLGMIWLESRWSPKAAAGSSSAVGLLQPVEPTYYATLATIAKKEPKVALAILKRSDIDITELEKFDNDGVKLLQEMNKLAGVPQHMVSDWDQLNNHFIAQKKKPKEEQSPFLEKLMSGRKDITNQAYFQKQHEEDNRALLRNSRITPTQENWPTYYYILHHAGGKGIRVIRDIEAGGSQNLKEIIPASWAKSNSGLMMNEDNNIVTSNNYFKRARYHLATGIPAINMVRTQLGGDALPLPDYLLSPDWKDNPLGKFDWQSIAKIGGPLVAAGAAYYFIKSALDDGFFGKLIGGVAAVAILVGSFMMLSGTSIKGLQRKLFASSQDQPIAVAQAETNESQPLAAPPALLASLVPQLSGSRLEVTASSLVDVVPLRTAENKPRTNEPAVGV